MKSKKKCCFIFSSNEYGEKFAKELQKRLGVVVEGNYCYAGYTIYVDRTAYRHALQVGTKILISNQLYMRCGGWVDHYNEVQSPNIGLVMYGFLPSNRKVAKHWQFDAPSDILEFKTKLSDFLGKEVHLTCNTADNAINVHVAPMEEHQTIKRDVRKFLQNHDTPFEKIRFFNHVGKLI